MGEFGVREAAQILGLSEQGLRGYLRAGLVASKPTGEGGYRFDFQDLVLLRTAKNLVDARIPPGRVRRALAALRRRLPEDQPLSGVQVGVEGHALVVRDRGGLWEPISGQTLLDFAPEAREAVIAPLEGRVSAEAFQDDDGVHAFLDPAVLKRMSSALESLPEEGADPEAEGLALDPSDWFELAEALETERRVSEARDALRRALELDPFDVEARLRITRLLEQEGRPDAAEKHLRIARTVAPSHVDLLTEHGRVLAQLGALHEALRAFETAMALEPDHDHAHLGAANLHERLGDPQSALRILKELRRRREDHPDG